MRVGRTTVALSVVVLLTTTSCNRAEEGADPEASPTRLSPSEVADPPSPAGVVPLPDGPLEPGRYRFVVSVECDGVRNDPIACPRGVTDPPPIPLVVTVPEAWQRMPGFPVILSVGPPEGSEGALVMGWTSNTVGVQSDPCLSKNHQLPDIAVGPGVDDFVDTVTSQEWYAGSTPVDTRVGGAPGRYFTLTGPADLSGCEEWRPWDPGFFAQGPRNIWEVWALDVDGHRVVVVAHYFPSTPRRTVAELRQMATSLRFPAG